MIKIGITGGIGSGKSTVCRVFGLLGIPCYDSDTEAKRLMNSDPELIERIRSLLGTDAYTDNGLNRTYVSNRVFGNASLLQQLDQIVHPAVEQDFIHWAETRQAPYVIEESAILFESGAYRRMDRTIAVIAPEETRIRRVCLRDRKDEAAVRARIAHQMDDDERSRRADYVLCTDERELLIPQILNLHHQILQL